MKLLRAAARSGADLFISTGTCSMSDIADAVEVVTSNGCDMPNLLHCYSVYPTDASDTNFEDNRNITTFISITSGIF